MWMIHHQVGELHRLAQANRVVDPQIRNRTSPRSKTIRVTYRSPHIAATKVPRHHIAMLDRLTNTNPVNSPPLGLAPLPASA
jgi:hypothetical protein